MPFRTDQKIGLSYFARFVSASLGQIPDSCIGSFIPFKIASECTGVLRTEPAIRGFGHQRRGRNRVASRRRQMPFSRGAAAGDTGNASKGACSRSSGILACRRTMTQPIWRYAVLHGNMRHHLSEREGREVFSVLHPRRASCHKQGIFPRQAVENAIRDPDWSIFRPPDQDQKVPVAA